MNKNLPTIVTSAVVIALGATVGWFWMSSQVPERDSFLDEEIHHDSSEEEGHILKLSAEQRENAGFEIRTAASGKLKMTLLLPGKLAMNPELYSQVVTKAGGVVKEARKNEGDQVMAGEVLALLESKEMAEAKGAYLAAQKRLALAQTTYERERRLFDKKIGIESEFLDAQAAVEAQQIELELAKQRLYTLGLTEQEIEALPEEPASNYRFLEVRAPFAGRVIARHLSNGEVIEAGRDIYVIADLSHVWVELGIYPKDAASVKEGQRLTVMRDGDEAEGKIVRISPVLDADSGRVKAVAVIDNASGQWRPGSFVSASLKKAEVDVPVLVSKDAVMKIENCDCLFVSLPNGFEKRDVAVGRQDDRNVEIVAGIKPGERYVSKNAFLLKFEMTKGDPE